MQKKKIKDFIHKFCQDYDIKNYIFTYDKKQMFISVNGNVDLKNKLGDMTKLPVKFITVTGWFDCSGNNLTTLEGCPSHVLHEFICDDKNKDDAKKIRTNLHNVKYFIPRKIKSILLNFGFQRQEFESIKWCEDDYYDYYYDDYSEEEYYDPHYEYIRIYDDVEKIEFNMEDAFIENNKNKFNYKYKDDDGYYIDDNEYFWLQQQKNIYEWW
jgi:hypothetical protein